MKLILFLLFSFVHICTGAQELGGVNPKTKLVRKKNQQATIIYPKELDSAAHNILQIFKTLDSTTKKSIGTKTKKWNVVLQNHTTIPNAYVRMAPKRSEFYMTPDMDNITSGTLPWAQLLATHEYRHIQQFSNFNNGLTKLFTLLLGEQGQLLANGITLPDYFFEGDAVYQETVTTQQGRGQLPSFFSRMKAVTQSQKKFNWMQLRNGSFTKSFPNHYELGYQIVAYGYEKYGNDFWLKVTKDASSFKGLFYAFQRAIKKHSGVAYQSFCQQALTHFKKELEGSNSEKDDLHAITKPTKPVTNFYFMQSTENDQMVYLKITNKEVPAFYKKTEQKEEFIAFKNYALDNYFSYKNNRIVYSSYAIHPRYGFTNYSNISIVYMDSKKTQTITTKSKLFHPEINYEGTQIIAVEFIPEGDCHLVLFNTKGEKTGRIVNPSQYIYTYPKYINNDSIICIIRNKEGANALAMIEIKTGATALLTPFTYKAMGYPNVQKNKVLFTLAHQNSDIIASYSLLDKKMEQWSFNKNSVFYPTIVRNQLFAARPTLYGQVLVYKDLTQIQPTLLTENDLMQTATHYLNQPAKNNTTQVESHSKEHLNDSAKAFRKGMHLFKFHSYQPMVTMNEISVSLLSDNIVYTMSSSINYTYNRDEQSHTVGINTRYGGLYPFINVGASVSNNRNVVVGTTLYNFNSAKLYTGLEIPLRKINGRYFQTFTTAATFNTEQILYAGIGKNIFRNRSFQYGSYFLGLSNQIQTAVQQIHPRWAQSIGISYRDAFTFTKSRKLVANSRFFFPGLMKTHSTVLSLSYQNRDTTPDFFSRTFAFGRGYESLNTRRMYRIGLDYHFPMFYPDWGMGNIFFIQRVRAAVFADYTNSRARLTGSLQNIEYKSLGTEIYFDGKIWNALPLNIGFRYARLLNTDLQARNRKNYFEIILPLDIIPR